MSFLRGESFINSTKKSKPLYSLLMNVGNLCGNFMTNQYFFFNETWTHKLIQSRKKSV